MAKPEEMKFDRTLEWSSEDAERTADPSNVSEVTAADTNFASGSAASLPAAAPATTGGPPVFGDYELLQEIARGGMGVVYKARQRSLNRIVALKMILQGQLATENAVQRFYQEARAAASLDHPNIVPIYEINQRDGHHYFTMAFIEGMNLKQFYRSHPMTPRGAVEFTLSIADGIESAHKQGIIHRDLKPDNVLIDQHNRPRITDFGLAKRVEDNTNLTATGQIVGTPAYMAPEQALGGSRTIGKEADVYALGGILYFLLTGRPPFNGETVTEVLCQVITDRPSLLHQINSEVPPDLESVVMKCLEKEPGKRYATAAALQDALRATSVMTGEKADATLTYRPVAGVPDMDSTPSARTMASIGGSSLFPSGMMNTNIGPIPSSANLSFAGEAPKQKSLLPAGILAAGLVLVGGVGLYLAFGQKSGTSDVKPTPTPTVEVAKVEPKLPGLPKVLPPKDLLPPLPPPLLTAKRKDFGLKVDFLAKHDAQGDILTMPQGGVLSLQVTTEKDCHVSVWSLGGDGTVVQLFPNKVEKDDKVQANTPRIIPGGTRPLIATPSVGVDQLYVAASTQPWNPLEGEKVGDFTAFQTTTQKNGLFEKLRGFEFAKDADYAEAVLKVKVLPKN